MDKRLVTELSHDYKDYVVNESGTIIEYQDYDEITDDTDQH